MAVYSATPADFSKGAVKDGLLPAPAQPFTLQALGSVAISPDKRALPQSPCSQHAGLSARAARPRGRGAGRTVIPTVTQFASLPPLAAPVSVVCAPKLWVIVIHHPSDLAVLTSLSLRARIKRWRPSLLDDFEIDAGRGGRSGERGEELSPLFSFPENRRLSAFKPRLRTPWNCSLSSPAFIEVEENGGMKKRGEAGPPFAHKGVRQGCVCEQTPPAGEAVSEGLPLLRCEEERHARAGLVGPRPPWPSAGKQTVFLCSPAPAGHAVVSSSVTRPGRAPHASVARPSARVAAAAAAGSKKEAPPARVSEPTASSGWPSLSREVFRVIMLAG
ncbi:hypothetical protein AAFF_G00019200 [Aldrovandia affinis]|uniref:Uncharacterized protein n=1 Tax=Aldrovandia affinis TaxID=143900 RepID=A0AAD7WGW2_9TELE|nr:hypothetical protein AAFF_G00019200 [Aldrovandia affinis]